MQPNGIFYITNDNKAFVCKTRNFRNNNIKYAIQSGPILISNGEINSKFNKSSSNKFIRNGVGILPNGNIVFVISYIPVNFYDFANYFKAQGCKNALYLDGVISEIYLPQKGYNYLKGEFSIIIAEVENKEKGYESK